MLLGLGKIKEEAVVISELSKLMELWLKEFCQREIKLKKRKVNMNKNGRRREEERKRYEED